MQHVSSKNNTHYVRSSSNKDNWRKQANFSSQKSNHINSNPTESIRTTHSKTSDLPSTALTMAGLIDSKFKIDTEVVNTQLCLEARAMVKETIKKFPDSEPRIRRVMEQPTFDLVCVSEKTMRDRYKGDTACFEPPVEKIFVTGKKIDSRYISHEFIHAYFYFQHTTPSTRPRSVAEAEKAILPFHPPTKESIKKYNKYLDLGDERIKKFKELMEKDKSSLSSEESALLAEYKDAAKDCLTDYIFSGALGKQIYSKMVASGWKPGNKAVLSPPFAVEIIDVKQGLTGQFLIARYINPYEAVFSAIYKVENVFNEYKNASDELRLAERDAHTFDHMSNNAIKTFYPEAYEMRTRDLEASCEIT